MGSFAAGQVVVLPFPFSNLEQNKYRPGLLLADVQRGDWLVCQITSQAYTDNRAIEIVGDDFIVGSLQKISYARAGKLFTAHETLFVDSVGRLHAKKLAEVKQAVIQLLQGYH